MKTAAQAATALKTTSLMSNVPGTIPNCLAQLSAQAKQEAQRNPKPFLQ